MVPALRGLPDLYGNESDFGHAPQKTLTSATSHHTREVHKIIKAEKNSHCPVTSLPSGHRGTPHQSHECGDAGASKPSVLAETWKYSIYNRIIGITEDVLMNGCVASLYNYCTVLCIIILQGLHLLVLERTFTVVQHAKWHWEATPYIWCLPCLLTAVFSFVVDLIICCFVHHGPRSNRLLSNRHTPYGLPMYIYACMYLNIS